MPESKVPPLLYFGRSEADFVIRQKGAARVHALRHFRSERVRLHCIPVRATAAGRHTTALRLITSRYHSALSLGVRFCVLKST